jgi:hypothetical protein
MADTITIQTSSSTDVVKIIERGPQGPQGPAGEGGGGDVESVNGQTGVVVLAAADVGAASTSHTHAASDITSGVLDFDRIQQVVTIESDGTSGTPTEVDLTTNIVGGNLHALVLILGASATTATKVVLPALGEAATGKVTVRVNAFEDPSDYFVKIVLDDDTAIFPASGYTEMDPDEELTFRWNDGRWDMDIRPNPSATTAVSIFKPATSGTLGLSEPSDSTFRIVGSSDATKKVAFEVDGLTAATTRTLTVPNSSGTISLTGHTHAAADITSGVLDFDRIQQVLTAQTSADDIDGPDIYDAAPYLVGGNLHALILASSSIDEGYLQIWLPDLAINAVGQVTVRGVDFPPYPTTCRVQITDEGDSPIFPATGFYEMVDGEEFTFRWNEGRWVMDLRPNPLATAVSHQIFKPNASGTLALNPMTTAGDIVVGGTSGAPARLALGTASQQLRVNSGQTSLEYFTPAAAFNPASPGAIGSTTPAAGSFTTLTANNGTLTASAPVLDLAQTWNASGVTFTGLRFNAAGSSDANSAAASNLAEFQMGGTNRLAVRKDGCLVFPAGNVSIFTSVGGASLGTVAGGTGFYTGTALQVNNQITTSNSNTIQFGDPAVTTLIGEATNALALRRSTNAQEFRVYGTITSLTNYQRLAIKTKAVTLSALSGASVATTGGFIPDGAVLVGLTTRVSTAITGATGYDIGDGSDADRWGANVAVALNTSSDNTNWTAGTIQCFTAAQEVTLTAVGSNFTGGAVVIVAHYLAGEAD